jgi:hypothetical protein
LEVDYRTAKMEMWTGNHCRVIDQHKMMAVKMEEIKPEVVTHSGG